MREQSTRGLLPAVLSILLVVVPSTTIAGITNAFAATGSPSGVMIALYTYPGQTWDTVIQAKNANPSVPIVAVINPASGPGGGQDSNYASGIQRMQAAGITVLGYVHTSYGSRDTGSLEAEISDYKNWYNTNGIFFDEMSNVAGYEQYYSNLNNYAKSLGFTYTVGNPGADTLPSYVGTVDNIVIYENSGLPSISSLGGWHTNYDKRNFSMVAYGVGSLDTSYVSSAANYVGFISMTDDTLPNPYDTVPYYFGNLVSAVGAANPTGSSSSPPPPATTYSITVNSADLNGNAVTGMWTTVQQSGVQIDSGFTPLSFNAQQGSTYQVTVANYKNSIFNHWEDGSTSSSRTITATQPTTLTAYYSTGSTSSPSPSPTPTPTPTTASLTINTQDSAGNAMTGYYTTLSQNGNTVSTAFSPATFTLNSGQSYTVEVQDYGNYAFDHWLDTGSTTRDRTVSISSNTQLTAVYKNTQLPPPDFAISASPSSLSLQAGSSGQSTVTVTSTNGFNSAVTLSGTPSIAGLGAAFSSSTVTPSPSSPVTSTLALSASPLTTPGTYQLTISGSSGSIRHSTTISLTVTAPAQSSIAVTSIDSNNNPLNGYYTTLSQNGATLSTAFTPATFAVTAGQQYTIEVQDYGNYHFDHWADNGSTNRDRTVTATNSSMTLTAVYTSGSSSSSPPSSPPSSGQSTISVSTADSSGNPLAGYYVTLWLNGTQIQSGFSPTSFTVNNNQTYQVAVSDYGSYVFDHWSDGTTSRLHAVMTGTGATTNLTAVYR
jgi:hypothetical protein